MFLERFTEVNDLKLKHEISAELHFLGVVSDIGDIATSVQGDFTEVHDEIGRYCSYVDSGH